MKIEYPIYISHDEEGYYAYLPDFRNHTEGSSLKDVYHMARDAISLLGVTTEDRGNTIPAPFSALYEPQADETLRIVTVDFDEYRAYLDSEEFKRKKPALSTD